jgi:hypothetical protein
LPGACAPPPPPPTPTHTHTRPHTLATAPSSTTDHHHHHHTTTAAATTILTTNHHRTHLSSPGHDQDNRQDLAVEALAALLHRCSKAERNILWPRLAPVLEQRGRGDTLAAISSSAPPPSAAGGSSLDASSGLEAVYKHKGLSDD